MFSSYRTVNTLRPHYKNQSVDAAKANNVYLFSDLCKIHKALLGHIVEFWYVTTSCRVQLKYDGTR